MGRNKQITSEICSKVIRCDHVEMHMKIQVNLSLKDPEQICKSILVDIVDNIFNKNTSKDETSMYSEKPKDLHSDGMEELHKPLTVDVDKVKLRNTLQNDNHEYEQKLYHEYVQKLELGKAIYEIITNDGVHQQSLRPEYKEALDLYTSTTS